MPPMLAVDALNRMCYKPMDASTDLCSELRNLTTAIDRSVGGALPP